MKKGKRARARDHNRVAKVGWQKQKEFYNSGGMKQKVSGGLPSLGKRSTTIRVANNATRGTWKSGNECMSTSAPECSGYKIEPRTTGDYDHLQKSKTAGQGFYLKSPDFNIKG